MKVAMDETERRRAIQHAYNEAHGITPATVKKSIMELTPDSGARDYVTVSARRADELAAIEDKGALLEALRAEMIEAAESLDFERAAALRDRIRAVEGGATGAAALGGAGAKPAMKVKRDEGSERSGGRGRGGPRGRGRR
jgi:excinuclease ABC subunit B